MKEESSEADAPRRIEEQFAPLNRRSFLKGAAVSAVGLAGVAAALQPLLQLEHGEITLDALLQKHYSKLSPDELYRILRDLEGECERQYGVKPIRSVGAPILRISRFWWESPPPL